MSSLKNIKESMGCNTILDDHNGGVVYQHVHMDKAAFDKMLAEVEEEYSALQAENEKLRKVAADIHKALFSLDIDHCQACPRDTINGPCTKYMAFGSDECSIEKDMRELGIEVS